MATITVTINPGQQNRLHAAFGKRLGLRTVGETPAPRNATAAEVKEQVIQFLVEAVRGQERGEAGRAAAEAVQDITPT